MTEHSDRAQFRAMTESTQEDWLKIATAAHHWVAPQLMASSKGTQPGG